MKRASLLAAAAVVLVANAFALFHAWRNRSAPPESDITLSERELTDSYHANDEDSGVTLRLLRTDPEAMLYGPTRPQPWLDQGKLQEIGFDTSVAPAEKTALEFYQRQRARRAFVALEYDGPGWRKWIDDVEQQTKKQSPAPDYLMKQRDTSSRLVAIDASNDASRLRERHPDRGTVIIVPAVVRIVYEPGDAGRAARLYGSIQEIPSAIHVPLPFSNAFRRVPKDLERAKYSVHVRYGSMLEPWIVGVEFAAR